MGKGEWTNWQWSFPIQSHRSGEKMATNFLTIITSTGFTDGLIAREKVIGTYNCQFVSF